MSTSRSVGCTERLSQAGAVWEERWNQMLRRVWDSLWNIRYMKCGKSPFRGNSQWLSSWVKSGDELCIGRGSPSLSGFRQAARSTYPHWTQSVSNWEGYPPFFGWWASYLEKALLQAFGSIQSFEGGYWMESISVGKAAGSTPLKFVIVANLVNARSRPSKTRVFQQAPRSNHGSWERNVRAGVTIGSRYEKQSESTKGLSNTIWKAWGQPICFWK